MEELSGDETLILFVSLVAAISICLSWYGSIDGILAFAIAPQSRLPFYGVPIGCLVFLLGVLIGAADTRVRGNVLYWLLFLAVAVIAIGLVNSFAGLMGINAIQDGIERRNRAAIWASCGIWISTTLCIAGANIGQGSSVYTTFGCMILAIGSLLGLWLLFARLSGNTACVAVDRDFPSGIRLAGLLVAWGLILGRAVAGDWVSTAQTLVDFGHQAWVALPLLGGAAIVDRLVQPRQKRPFPSHLVGWLPAFLYLMMAVKWVVQVGWWS